MPEVLLDLLLLLVLSGALRKLLGGVMAGMKTPPRSEPRRPREVASVHMERDPVCGTFVVPDRAVSLALGSGRVYFCSQACCDRYRQNPSAVEPGPRPAHNEYARGRTA